MMVFHVFDAKRKIYQSNSWCMLCKPQCHARSQSFIKMRAIHPLLAANNSRNHEKSRIFVIFLKKLNKIPTSDHAETHYTCSTHGKWVSDKILRFRKFNIFWPNFFFLMYSEVKKIKGFSSFRCETKNGCKLFITHELWAPAARLLRKFHKIATETHCTRLAEVLFFVCLWCNVISAHFFGYFKILGE